MKLRYVFLMLNIAYILQGQNHQSSFQEQQSENKHWVMVWHDEFNYEGFPDPYKWNYDIGGGGWGNDDLAFYTHEREENVYVKDGLLRIKAQKERFKGSGYTSSRIHTRHKGDWKYGRIEVRAKVSTGRGILHSIWMLPRDSSYGVWPESGEIDIMEHAGHDIDKVYSAVHTSLYNHKNMKHKYGGLSVENLPEKFETYSIEWTPWYIHFFVGNNIIFTYRKESSNPKSWPFDKEFYLILSTGVGGIWAGLEGIDDTLFPHEMQVDWVRVYQHVNKSSTYKIQKKQPYNGSVEFIPDTGTYNDNQKITVKAIADEGYVFDRWEGSLQGEHNPLTFKINRDMNITPIFKRKNEILLNTTFSMGKRDWVLQLFNSADATLGTFDNKLHITVEDPGEKPWDIQLNQNQVHLEKGKKYRISVTFKSDKRRWISFGIARNFPPYKPYISHRVFVNKRMRTYHVEFKMRHDEDFNGRFFIDLGDSRYSTTIESISCQEID